MRHPRRSAPLLVLAGSLGILGSAHAQCHYNNSTDNSVVPTGVDYPVSSGTCQSTNRFDPYTSVPNHYAILYYDAQNPSCASGARTTLEAKLTSNVNYASSGGKVCDPRKEANGQLPSTDPFQVHLMGGSVAAIFATAVTLMDAGLPVNDTLLQGVRNHYQGIPTPQDPTCGVGSLPNVNSCMDDYTLTAAGYGWIAAYEAKKGRSTNATTFANLAKAQIAKALSPWNSYGSVCYYVKGSSPIRCDGTQANVTANQANVIGADHYQENPGYGLGLMTSIATACKGLDIAGDIVAGLKCSFTDPTQIFIAQQFLIQGQQRTYYDTTAHDYRFNQYCRQFQTGGNVGCWDPLFGPSNLPGYLPTIFPMKRFYDAMGLTPSPLSAAVNNGWGDSPAYQFHEYREPRFSWDRTNFWGPARKLIYDELACELWPAHTPQAFIYWIQPAALAGFGAPGTLTVAGGSTQSGSLYPVQMSWRDVTTNSAWTVVPFQATPDPNGNPKDVWYNSVPAPTNPYDVYEVSVKHASGPSFSCIYQGNNTIWWCKASNNTPAWP
jgi:hypothetical protein